MNGRGRTDSIPSPGDQAADAYGAGTPDDPGGPPAAGDADEPEAGNGAAVRQAPLSQDRLAAFSDGVFAVAITVLVFGIPQPHPKSGQLGHALLQLWPSYVAYATSFLTIGIIWVNHHSTFARVARVDRPLLFVNLVLLMTVCFIPFPTSLLSQFVAKGGSDATAAAFAYAATMTSMSIAFGWMWVYAVRHGMFHLEHTDPRRTREIVIRFTSGGVVYASCMAIAFISPIATLVLYALLAVYYVFDQQA
jgi:uncharacterized membrane protein